MSQGAMIDEIKVIILWIRGILYHRNFWYRVQVSRTSDIVLNVKGLAWDVENLSIML